MRCGIAVTQNDVDRIDYANRSLLELFVRNPKPMLDFAHYTWIATVRVDKCRVYTRPWKMGGKALGCEYLRGQSVMIIGTFDSGEVLSGLCLIPMGGWINLWDVWNPKAGRSSGTYFCSLVGIPIPEHAYGREILTYPMSQSQSCDVEQMRFWGAYTMDDDLASREFAENVVMLEETVAMHDLRCDRSQINARTQVRSHIAARP